MAGDAREKADAWEIIEAFAQRGILVAPGTFYGEASRQKVRMSLTGSDEAIDAAAQRLKERPLFG